MRPEIRLEPRPERYVELRLDGRSVRRWHIALLERLSRLPGLVVTVDASPGPGGLPAGAALLLRLDALLYGHARGAAARAGPEALAPYRAAGDARAELVLDLCGDVPSGAGRVWRLDYAGAPGEAALLGLLLGGHAPVATVTDISATENAAPRVVAIGRLGAEHNGSLVSAFEDFLARTMSLVEAALAGTAAALPELPEAPEDPPSAPPTLTPKRLGRAAARQIALSSIRHGYRLAFASPHWRIGWRRLDGPDLFALRDHPAGEGPAGGGPDGGWRVLADDGHRFYADPFPVAHAGGVTLFVEEFAHRLGKGVISAVAFGPEGPLGTPRIVLEQPYHLSYPFVFAADGEMWMIPESCASRSIELFRATRFPGGWVKAATLVCDVVASDATLVEHDGRWWMFATVRDRGGAFSDALHLWWAADFRGPWTPHQANPVMIDIASARPAGRIVRRDGALLRPVQDCRRGYGAALGIARILRLDEDGFEQRVETILRAGPRWPGRRLHTLNNVGSGAENGVGTGAGGFEFIDGSARVRRRLMPPRPG